MTAALLVALSACGGQATGAAQNDPSPADVTTSTPGSADQPLGEVRLDFNHGGVPGEPIGVVGNTGSLPVRTEVISLGSGEVRSVWGFSKHGRAVKFPEFGAKDAGYAILSVVNLGEEDLLSPGGDDFVFGGDLRLDAAVTGGTDADDGDNLIQRGLFGTAAQYKIQIDGGRVSCRIQGLRGAVLVKLGEHLKPRSWYRVRCTREADTVTLAVTSLTEDGQGAWTVATDEGPIGDVIMPAHTPLTVGGKLAADGTLFPSSTDQFNGKVDRIFYRLLR